MVAIGNHRVFGLGCLLMLLAVSSEETSDLAILGAFFLLLMAAA